MLCNRNISNSDKRVICFLAHNFAGTKRVRNTILFYSIAISIIAVTMVFGIPMGKIRAEEIRIIRENGSASSGVVTDATEQQYNKLKQLNYIKDVGKSVFVGEAAETNENVEDAICKVAWVDADGWNQFIRPAYTDITGDYPKTKEEILLSERTLKKLGILKPKQGMKIDLEVSIGLFRHSKERFQLCGWYRDFCNEQSVGYISKDKIREWDFPENHYTLLFKQADNWEQSKTEDKLYRELPVKDQEQKIVVSDTARYTAVSKFAGGYEMMILGTLSILCGIFFLVRNVLWISMNEDVRNLGLLNTIGATEKQIAKIYRKQMQSVMLKGTALGSIISVGILIWLIPEILGFHFFHEMGGKTILCFFRPWILFAAVVFVNGILWIASENVIRKTVNMSCVKSSVYDGSDTVKKVRRVKKIVRKRTEAGEMLYFAWKNVTFHRKRFIITCFSMFLGILSFLIMNVITEGCDYIHIIEKRPDFLLTGEFSEYGKSQGYGQEYKAREIDIDPLLTKGDGTALLYDNSYDEFSPISEEVKRKIQKIEGIDWNKSEIIEGAYLNTIISKKGIRPYEEGISDMSEGNMVEGFTWDTVQILKSQEIAAIRKYVYENQLNIDIESLENGTGVLIIHDHMLTPEQQKMTEDTVGEPIYFKTLLSKKDVIYRNGLSELEREKVLKEDTFFQKNSKMFSICGYLDGQSDGFPEISQSWHGAEGSLYFFVSESGFVNIPTGKKILGMELNVQPEKEPHIKEKIEKVISEENRRRSKMTEVSLDKGTGESGIFAVCKSDLIKQKETYMRGNRILLGGVSMVLLIAGLTNYFNVVAAGMYSRRKEFDIMQSIGMTDKQMKRMLYGEGCCYFGCTLGMIFTVGTGILLSVRTYMENKLSYFIFHWPVFFIGVIILFFFVINIATVYFVWRKR